MTLLTLCLAAFALVCLGASVAIGLAMPLWDRLAERLPGRTQARYWVGIALLPSLLACTAVVAALLPSFGLSPDHCLAHGNHHLHLCPRHLTGAPPLGFLALSLWVPARLAQLCLRSLADARLGFRTARSLREGAQRVGDAWLFAGKAPEAFVLGCKRPEVFLSEGLLALGGEVYEAALAHERDHARHRDSAFRMGFPLLAAGHVPWVAHRLALRHSLAQEFAADAAAARVVDGPLAVAEALLTIARSATRAPLTSVGFVQGDMGRRVHALLSPPPATRNAAWPATLVLALGMLGLAGLSHHEIHHGLESLLGLLQHAAHTAELAPLHSHH